MVEWKVLQGVGQEERELVLRAAERRRYRKGATLFREGDPGESFVLIERGTVAVRITTPAGDVATLNVLGAGESFGEMALVTDNTRSASVAALEDTVALVLHRAAFEDLCRRHPSVYVVLVGILAAQLRRLSSRVVEALYVSAETRVLRRLADLAAVYDRGDGGPVTIPLTQEVIATMAGTTRPTLNKVLQQATALQLVSVGRGAVTVVDVCGLRRQAGY
jgi:CRP/FNR family transcriptional regulator, cyclic AMP receptor protein